MRLLGVQLETSAANEKRIESEAGALRAEIARQETLLSSVHRIEASLMAKAESELENLQVELKRVQESKSDDVTKHDATVKKLEGKIADLERIVKDFTDQKEAATVSAAEATLDCSKLNHKVQELSLELKAAEKKLKSAKILGAKVAPTAELASTKFELTTAQTWITVYKEMAVNELTATIDSLTSQLSGSREDAFKAIARLESLTSEARRYQLDAKNSNANYERDLALHTEAHAALRDARSGMESEQRLHDNIESQRTAIETEKVAWETSKKKLEESLLEAKSKLDDLSTI
jgi:nucleoprotein TPR